MEYKIKSFVERLDSIKQLPLWYILLFICFIYISLSIHFNYERILNTDCSYQLFNIINNKTFFFQEYRYGVFLSQIPLIIAIFCKFPITVLVFIYSFSFPVLYIIIGWICWGYFKSKEATLSIALSMITGVGATFFHFITETHLLIVISCLIYAILQNNITYRHVWHQTFLLFLFITWAFITHPNALFTIGFVVGLSFIQKKISFLKSLIIMFFFGALMFLKIILTPQGSYDSNQYNELLLFGDKISHLFSSYSFEFIKSRLSQLYFTVIIMLVLTCFFYKRKWEIIFTLISFCIYTLLSIITFSKGDSDAMMEKSFMPGIFMIVLVFSVFINNAKHSKLASILIIVIAILSFCNINKAGRPYSNRIELLTSILSQSDSGYPKLIASFSDYNAQVLEFSEWATSIDTLLLSLCLSEKPRTLFIVNNKEDYANEINNKNIFMYLPWKQIKLNDLNADYFKFPDVPYKLITKN
jgi:hypothetical protein